MKKSLSALAAVVASTAVLVPLFAPAATATSPRVAADTTFGVNKVGTVSVLGKTGQILGGQVVKGSGSVGVEILGNRLDGILTNASATATTFNSNIKIVFGGNTLNMVAAFTGSNWTYSGTTTGDLALEFSGLKVTAVHPPHRKKAQYPVKCPPLPKTLKKNQTTVIFHKTCLTNAGQKVRVQLATHAPRGDVRGPIARLFTNRNGAVVIRTYNRSGIVVLREWAPETAKYKMFSTQRTYSLR